MISGSVIRYSDLPFRNESVSRVISWESSSTASGCRIAVAERPDDQLQAGLPAQRRASGEQLAHDRHRDPESRSRALDCCE
jgi:hypothetical protein